MKKIMMIGVALVACLFCVNVNAEETFVWSDDYQIDISSTIMAQDYEDEKLYINLETNNEEFNINEAYYYEKGYLKYKINDNEYEKVTKEAWQMAGSGLWINYSDIQDILALTNELEISVYFETIDGDKTPVSTKKVLILENEKTLIDTATGVSVYAKHSIPYGTTLKVKEITDEQILNNIAKHSGFTNLTVWEIEYKAYDKNMTYYKENYGYDDETSQGMVWSVAVTFPVPKKYNHTEELDIMAYMVSKDYKNIDTRIQFGGDENDLTKYTLTLFEEEYMDYYFVMSDKTKFVSDETPIDQSNAPAAKDDTVESPKTGIEDYALFILGGLALTVTSITIINRNKKFKRI